MSIIAGAMGVGAHKEYGPGDLVPESGIYRVTHDDPGTPAHEVTCIDGKRFPPARTGKKCRFVLVRAAVHIDKHPAFKP